MRGLTVLEVDCFASFRRRQHGENYPLSSSSIAARRWDIGNFHCTAVQYSTKTFLSDPAKLQLQIAKIRSFL